MFDTFKFQRAVVKDENLSCAARHLLLTISAHLDKSGQCWPSQKTLAREMRCSPRRVQTALQEAKTGGWIETRRRPNNSAIITARIGNIC